MDDDASIVGSGGGARDNLGVAPRKEELGLFISKHGRVDREAWMLPFKWRLKREIALHTEVILEIILLPVSTQAGSVRVEGPGGGEESETRK